MGLATELYLFGEKSFFSREIVKPAIVISAYSCVMVHNHPAATLVLLKRI
jgi:DNA repair protein RadC